jgi:hypothetical protein
LSTSHIFRPYRVIRKRDHFEVRRGRALLAAFDNFADAEDAARRAWLYKSLDDEAKHHRLMLLG